MIVPAPNVPCNGSPFWAVHSKFAEWYVASDVAAAIRNIVRKLGSSDDCSVHVSYTWSLGLRSEALCTNEVLGISAEKDSGKD